MIHLLAVFVTLLYWVVLGHGHTWIFAALMLGTIRNDWRRPRQP